MRESSLKILGIETSCDETAIAIYDTAKGLLANTVHSQIDLHTTYGGVVPELASRDHVKKITPLLKQTLQQATCDLDGLDGIAYSAGPGLTGALLVGAAFAKSLGFALNIPVVAIHHMEAHLLAPFLEPNPPTFPFVALLVSGGHTLLVEVSKFGCYRVLGESIDDAVGEAFDKTAKLLGLGYPGGPLVAQLAEIGNTAAIKFPRPMLDRDNCDFSFSGLKTAVLHAWENSDKSDQDKADIAAAFQAAAVETLIKKSEKALNLTGYKCLVVAGGVSANKELRHQLQLFATKNNISLYFPRPEFCTDNAAMVALAGAYHINDVDQHALRIWVTPRWELNQSRGTNG